MVISLFILGAIVLVWPIASGLSHPASSRSQRNESDRRLRWVARHPDQVNSGDIARLLLAHELPSHEVRLILDKAGAVGIKPLTMWMWIQRFDVHALALVVGADLKHRELLEHLSNGTVPDMEELKVFAALNGLSVSKRVTKRPVAARQNSAGVRLTRGMPAIFEPGSWPYGGELSALTEIPPTSQDDGTLAA